MEFKKNAKYALIAPSSMGVRITPVNRLPVHISNLFLMQATSAETNVLSISAALGLPVKVLTCFVKGSPIANFIKGDLRRRGIDYEGPEREQGGPWGFRHQF
ncbi:MAG TPA: sugar kinase, partial [Acholeplasmataceae bacterium]|nr:sugar kinase [Acholeplasmataceae bacterium]